MSARPNAYMICTSPRSGSTLLCRLLAATGFAGLPDSHFHRPELAAWLKTYGLSHADFTSNLSALKAIFAAAIERGTGATGLFGLRMQRVSFDFFMQQLTLLHPDARTDTDRIAATFGQTRFIHLTRLDKLAQAISLVKAQQTGLWHRAADGSELERASAPRAPVYDADAIHRALSEVKELEAAWAEWFDQQAICPSRITYEDLSNNPTATLSKVLDTLGLDPASAEGIQPPVAQLADATNADWASRFRAQSRSIGR
ncbi:MAG: sulfotransferase [Rhodobacteraceae bacterium]|nr:sulfotransferase [Paracoccaceae bacterium]